MPPPRGLVQQVDEHLHRAGLLPPGSRVLVACSGGADSVALLRLLAAVNGSRHWRWELLVGHVEHGLRGRQSTADARFVKKLAGELGLPFLMRSLRLKRGKGAGRISENAARDARFRALAAMARQARADRVALAHHADDQAETVLMRMIRGAGLEGLAAMAADTYLGALRIVRPLLGFRRADLRTYLESIGQPWREDATNASPDFLRNRLRAEVLPLLEDLRPGASSALGRLATLAREAQAFLAAEAQDLLAEAKVRPASRRGRVMDRSAFRDARPLLAREALRQAAQAAGAPADALSFERLAEAARIVQGTHGRKTVQLGGGVEMRVEGALVRLARAVRKGSR